MKKLLKIFAELRDGPENIFVPSAREMFLADAPVEDSGADFAEREFRFYSSISLGNGVTKKTSRGRLRDLDDWLVKYLPPNEKPGKKLQMLDLGVSAGVTTVELAELLTRQGFSFHITAADLYIDAYLLIAGERESVLLDREGYPVHYELDGRGIGNSRGKNIIRRIRLSGLERFAANWLRRYGKQLRALKAPEKIGGFAVHPVKLLCRAIRENSHITVIEADVFSGDIHGEFGLVRAANLLNLAYFPEEKLRLAIENIKKILAAGGLLLIARTEMDNTTNGTLFHLKEDGGFRIVERFGSGSELEALILR